MNPRQPVVLSVVIPVFNEEEVLPILFQRLGESLSRLRDISCEIVLVNDGSTDGSGRQLRRVLHQ